MKVGRLLVAGAVLAVGVGAGVAGTAYADDGSRAAIADEETHTTESSDASPRWGSATSKEVTPTVARSRMSTPWKAKNPTFYEHLERAATTSSSTATAPSSSDDERARSSTSPPSSTATVSPSNDE